MIRQAQQCHRAAMLPIALALILALSALGTAGAATPGAGVISDAQTVVTWTGNPLPPTATATCTGPTDPACDHFNLTVEAPAGPFAVEITISASLVDDYDLQVFGTDGAPFASSGNPPGAVEIVTLVSPASGTYTVSAANFAAVTAYTGRAELVALEDPPAAPGQGALSFAVYNPPGGAGASSGEPSIGVNWNTDRVMFIAGLETLKLDFDDCSSPGLAEWTDVSFPLTGTVTLDPILFTDPVTGRTFASQLGPKCSAMAFTDDDGANWLPSQGCGINAGVDHQTVGGGPFAAPLERDPNGLLYPHAVYYCSQDIAIAQCARSDTGGLTFAEATPIYDITACGGLHGHVKVAPNDGTVYVPNKGCNGEQAVVVTEQNGLLGTWNVRRIPGTTSGEWDPSVGIGTDGTIYVGMTNGGRPMIAVSHDKGLSWSDPYDVGIGVGPSGGSILNTAFPVVVAGDGDRAAFGFLGAEQGGDAGGEDPNSGHVFYAYVAVTFDGGATWSTTSVDPGDPVQRGTVCSAGTTCGSTRNLLDFNDMTVDREGRVLFGYADGCIGSCVGGGPGSGSALATVARQKGGRRLFAAFDALDLPDAPLVSAELDPSDESRVVITWQEPDDHGSAIFEYRIYRRFEGAAGAEQVGSVSGSTFEFVDVLGQGDASPSYRVSAVNAFGEGPTCLWVSPVFAAPPENGCAEPGITVLEDAPGDATGGQAAHDLRALRIAQPTALGGDRFVFRLEMAGLGTLTPSTTWPVVFVSADGNSYFVKMATDLLGAVRFEVGAGTNPSVAGQPADPDSGFDADGTIRIVVPASAIGSPQAADQLSGFLSRIRIELALGSALTPDNMPDGAVGAGSYTAGDCAAVEHCARSAVSDAFHAGNHNHALWLPGINKRMVLLGDATMTELPDGSARLTGTAVDRVDAAQRFAVDVYFADPTNAPPPGSPKKELKSSAYAEKGGPVDTTTWRYYQTLRGTLSGEALYDGAVVNVVRRGAAFQIGFGASGKNVRFGGSGWIDYDTEQQPTTGLTFPGSGRGDFNLLLECDD